MKRLVLAEKPSVGRDIAKVLKCSQKINGGFEGSAYVVTWALGHLVTLADPEKYDDKYKEWKLEHLPMLPKHMELVVIKQTSKQYQEVKNLIKRNDINEIIIATDAGREGELVARWILEKSGSNKPIKRLWISSVTDKAIKEGFANLKDGKEYLNLYRAAAARAESDWIVGMNATRALTCKYNAQLSCGRVQTPTLSMIAKREEEINTFIPKNYYGVSIKSQNHGIVFTWKNPANMSYKTFDIKEAEKVLKEVEIVSSDTKKELIITDVKKKDKKVYSPALYDLTELQRDANKLYDFSAKETLNIMQRLYENHKVLTYPRTDSRYITTDIVPTLKERLLSCNAGAFAKTAAMLSKKPINPNASFVNNDKVTDHHAIIPTEQYVDISNMTIEERKIYELVIKRFLAVLMPPYEYEQTTIIAKCGLHEFNASGKVVKILGFKELYTNRDDETTEESELTEQLLPTVKIGDKIKPYTASKTEGKTKPPSRFNEGTLLTAMENPVKYMDKKDAEAVKTIGETGGLGTVATRADIIEKLFHTFLIEKKNKDIIITAKGKQLLELVPKDLKKPDMTAELEMKLSKVAKGMLKPDVLMEEMREYTKLIVDEIKGGSKEFKHDNLTNKKCPECGKRLLSVNGKNTKMLACQDRECGYREVTARVSNARCPVCHKKMEVTGNGENQTFICACGHKEKLAAFQERRNKEGAGIKKKDVQSYMKNQEKEEQKPFNSPFSGIKL